MEQLVEEFGHPTFTSFPVIVARLALAALLGAAIGFEREWQARPAGLRTHMLVCIAAATFAILTIEIVHAPMFTTDAMKEAVKVDPIRVVEAVTAGVAFLAAGIVIFTRGEVHGLTTGAGMWLAGAIGVAAGLCPCHPHRACRAQRPARFRTPPGDRQTPRRRSPGLRRQGRNQAFQVNAIAS
jgi:putative Mg2+ transporter-C (MgtC) family protein